ncbi:MAG: hypothetical protein BWK78_08100 [Thiotrichaceae bacterium IS1]|nr:MAG: hypothetical protein BWK78_08100 [Thiotrichaceae bacterium IS1]
MKSFQTGIALITVLLIVAIATMLAVAMTSRQQLDIFRTTNLIHHDQAYLYALGGESWSKWILWREAQDRQIDHLHELWATPLPPLPIEGGTLQGQLEDLQGRFNLNNLVPDGKVNPDEVIRFQRLLKALELPPALAQIVVDWIDSDEEPQIPDGAEDNVYLLQTPAYRAANTPFRSPSEVRLLATVDQEIYQKLLPHICTLPTRTPINVNTATLPVLMTLADGLTADEVNQLRAAREQKPFQTIQEVITHQALAGYQVETDAMAVSSEYFLLTVHVQIDRAKARLSTVLHRDRNRVEVVMRSQGDY